MSLGAAGGEIEAYQEADLGGTWNVMNSVVGEVIVTGEFQSTGLINVGSVGSLGQILIQDEPNVDHAGDIVVNGVMQGVIDIDGGLGQAGSVAINGQLRNRVDVSGGMNGTLHAAGSTGDIMGAVVVAGGLTQTGSIVADGKLGPAARITVNGLSEGDIRIGKQTDAGSRIHLPNGLGSTGVVYVNDGGGNFNANGSIYVGPLLQPPGACGFTTFDGCVHIFGSPPYGDLGSTGLISVIGCHATGDDLSICVDGDVLGTISINQNCPDCANFVTYSCPPGGC